MRALGTLGRPEEYLRVDLDDVYRERWGLASDASGDALIAAMTAHGRTRNGVFGIKLHWFQFELLLRRLRALRVSEGGPNVSDDAALLGRYFGSVRWVHLERSDTLRQAVSWYRAIHTDEWWRVVGEPDPGRSVEYDFEAIKHLHYLLLDYRRAWRGWFDAHGDHVLRIGYEELSSRPRRLPPTDRRACGCATADAAAVTVAGAAVRRGHRATGGLVRAVLRRTVRDQQRRQTGLAPRASRRSTCPVTRPASKSRTTSTRASSDTTSGTNVGATAFTRTPNGRYSTAIWRVSTFNAALEAP